MPHPVQRPRPATSVKARSTSLADVAALAGVSAGTVSRALSKPGMISDATRERVLAAVARLGYVANGAARALSMRRTMTIGAIVPRFGTSSFPMMIQALEARLAAEGYTLLLSAPEHQRSQEEAILRTLLERGVDAVALLGAEQETAVLNLLATHKTPYVTMWAPPAAGMPAIGFDEHAAAALLVDHLHGLGHRRLAFVGGRTSDNERARRRIRGLVRAVAKRGMTLGEDAVIETEYGFREGFAAMNEIAARRTRVTAVVCGNDYLAAGALAALDRAGIAVPSAISVASFNDNDFAAYLHPPLTTVRLPIGEIGDAAGRWLIAKLRGDPLPELAPLPTRLVVRSSTARVARTAGSSVKVRTHERP